ncbi:MAG: DUF433 domain-containing protein [Lysobacteraceae bacterium]|nr:MAG: DUF433 domain-containing protein [Xanthomonadaceae bacterium]
MNDVIAAFSAEQAGRLAGLSIAQLRDWDNHDFFRPSLALPNRREPYSRIYSFEDLVGLRTLALLRTDYGVSKQHLARAAYRLRQHHGKPWSALTLYVFNREVHFKNPQTGTVEGAVSGQRALPIKLASVAEDLRAKAESMRQRDPSTEGKVSQKRYTMRGTPVVAGTRIPISSIKAFADAGFSSAQIVEQYPSLSRRDVEAALEYDHLTQAA